MTIAALNTPKEYALCYHGMGFAVFVLKNEPAVNRKRPAVNWELYQIMRASKIQIERWFTKNPNYNIAVATGSISNIIAVDVDGPTAAERLKQKIPEMSINLRVALKNTMVNHTGSGGQHIILRLAEPTDVGGAKTIWTDGKPHSEIKLKGNGGYILMPPSLHESGNRYEWNAKELDLITKQEINELIRVLGSPRLASDESELGRFRQSVNLSEEGRTLTEDKSKELLNWIKPYYNPGSRNDIIFYLSGMFRLGGFTQKTARSFITVLCNTSGYPDEDLAKSLDVVDNTYEKPIEQVKGKSGLHNLLITSHADTTEDTNDYLARVEAYARICQITNPLPSPLETTKEETRAPYGAVIQQQIAGETDAETKVRGLTETLERQYRFAAMEDTEELFYYNTEKGVFDPAQSLVKAQVEKQYPGVITSTVSNVLEKLARRHLVPRNEFDKDSLLRNVKNGIVNLLTGERYPHDPIKHPSLIQIPHNYYTPQEMRQRLVSRPKGSQFLCKKILFEYLCNVADVSDIILAIEFWGYDLIGDNRFQKALMATGPPDSGKSTLVDITEAFLGKKNCANKTLKELTINRFAKADLYGKLANTCADISNSRLDDIETFKMLVTGDDISAEKKNKDAFDYKPKCKIHVSANTPPLPKNETDEAFYKRWVLLLFAMKKGIVINRNLLQEIIEDENELDDLLHLAVQAAGKILRQGGFSGGARSRDINTIMEEYMRKARPTIAWIEDNCVIGSEYEGDKYRLFEDFKDYCKKHRLPSINSLIGFARELRGLYHVEDAQRGGRKQKRKNVWVGISLIKDLRPEEQTEILGEPKYE